MSATLGSMADAKVGSIGGAILRDLIDPDVQTDIGNEEFQADMDAEFENNEAAIIAKMLEDYRYSG
jgi:hypothetical protein